MISLVGAKSEEPYRGAPMLPTNWVKANESVEDVAKRMVTCIGHGPNLSGAAERFARVYEAMGACGCYYYAL